MRKDLLDRPKLVPLLKWAGGKTKLLNILCLYIKNRYKTYIEPFLGGGSVFLRFHDIADKWIISDSNKELIHFYITVRDYPEELMKELDLGKYRNDETTYYRLRKLFNDKRKLNIYDVELAALFLYLNKHCYNGVYRVNSNGEFNVPFGKYIKPVLYNKKNLLGWSKLLKSGRLCCSDYKRVLALANEGDFVYLDPPYDHTFNGYTEDSFNQEDLRNECDMLKLKNIALLQSNSKTVNIENLYKQYEIHEIESWDSLGQNIQSRNKRKEVIIR